MNEKQKEMFNRINNTPHLLSCDVLRKDFIDLIELVKKIDNKLNQCESLLSEAHDMLDDVHCYDTDLYEEITKYLYND